VLVRVGVRAKLFAVSCLLILAITIAGGLYLAAELRDGMQARIAGELDRATSTILALLDGPPGDPDRVAVRAAATTGYRVTLLDSSGQVIGDSHYGEERFHRLTEVTRPEIQPALDGDRGANVRYSTQLGEEALYVARPLPGGGVLRVAARLDEVDRALDRLRRFIIVAGILGLVIAVMMSTLASHLLLRTLREMVVTAREIASGKPRRRLDTGGESELSGLAGSLNKVAEELERRVAALARERTRLEEVLEGMSEAVLVIDGDQQIGLLNPASETMLGLDDRAVGLPLIEFVRVPALQELISPPISPRSAEFQLPGQTRQIRASVTPRKDRDGCILVLHDVTEIRRLERIRRDFVANVSHELRTPVSIVRANAETLLDGAMNDPTHGKRLMEGVHRNAERLGRIIDDLLALSRLEARRFPIESSAVSLAELCGGAVASLADRAESKQIEIETRVDERLSVQTDRAALDHVLVNLLDNAIKYTPAGGHVILSAWSEDDQVRIEVRDDGPGIAPHHRSRIFERFYRIDPGRSRDMGGTGLGLSIVKHLVEAMGGTVGVEAAEPEGSIFWVLLPRE
jgi:two-component system, OmpR family, phosphate regulon sensor histidine kinase PhoR